jgi:hypothetical protein
VAKVALTLALAALLAGNAHALNKCTDPKTGKVSFQDAPCASGLASAAVKVSPSGGAAPPPGESQGAAAEQRALTTMVRERRVRELSASIGDVERAIERRNTAMNSDLEALRQKKGYARNNLAGATWENSISTEMQAVVAKHQAANAVDNDRLKRLRDELETVRTAAVLR